MPEAIAYLKLFDYASVYENSFVCLLKWEIIYVMLMKEIYFYFQIVGFDNFYKIWERVGACKCLNYFSKETVVKVS